MRKRSVRMLALLLAVGLVTTGCGDDDSDGGTEGAEPAEGSDISGSITVLTNRTDIVDTVFADYRDQFNEIYPDVEVEFEALTDYEGEVRIRMNSEDYGDVLLIPNDVTEDQLPDFFEPLGSVEDLGEDYRFINEQAFEGQVYGIAVVGNANGFVYNKAVWEEAGVTDPPTTPDEFVDALQAIADETDAIPLYTNYAAGWPMTQWESNRGSITNDPEYVNEMAHTDAPWAEGTDHFVIDSLIYDIAAAGLIEDDPTTTDWESSKARLGNGEIATMALGSWALVQMQEAAENADDVGYLPFPNQVDGTFESSAVGDYKIGINKSSDDKAAARAWIDWFLDESGFAYDQGGLSPRIDGEAPTQLADFEDLGVEYVEIAAQPEGEEGLTDRIDAEAEVGLFDPIYRQRIVDAARGEVDESLDDIFADLNDRWAAAREELGVTN